ncbi:MAG TPA: MFS transporter [Gaiellales bacterium]|jgi:DHA1 family inner membrane transport protein
MRRPFLLFYALVFLDEVALLSLVPLLPSYTRAYHLSAVQAGALLSASSLAIVVASVPAGRLSDRFGARIVTLAAGAIAALSMLATALAPGFATLLAARAAFGVGSGTIWSAGISWLSDSAAEESRDRALAMVVTVAGIGSTVGPVFAGLLADRVGRGSVFAFSGVLMTVVVCALAFGDPGRRRRHGHQPLRRIAAGMRSEPLLAGAVAIMLLGGVGDGVVNLVAPLQLGHLGLSSAAIGAWFSVASIIFIASSAVIARMGRRAVSLRLAGVMAVLQAVALIPVLASGAAAPIVGMVLARAFCVGPPYAMAFPLGALGATRLGFGTGTVNGLMGLVWGGANFAGPLIAGIVIAGPGDRAAYALLAAFSLVLALMLIRAGRRESSAPAAAAP